MWGNVFKKKKHNRVFEYAERSILYIENIEIINSRGCYWIATKPKYVIKKLFVCLSYYTTERELNSSSSIEYLGLIDIYKMLLSELLKMEK
uniref:SFRICE_037580 n=1 Tax=Spodoptera frugiperda TaxID=7108 RepID=A0A2H1VEY0_SPOFR